jgi:acetyltransferase-like isoleucine patch superfamily enzyme
MKPIANKNTAIFWKAAMKMEAEVSTKIHELAYVHPSAKIGRNVQIWQFASILKDAVIGDNVSIGSCAEIGRGSVIGENSRISRGVFLPSNSKVGKSVFIGPNCTFTDDKHPRVGNIEYDARPPILEDYCAIGAGSVGLPGIVIGWGSLVGAGSTITKSVPAQAVAHNKEYAKVI